MARITRLQKEIFDLHLDAFKNNSFKQSNFTVEGETPKQTLKRLREALMKRETIESVWNYVWTKEVSITSQVMASNQTFRHITDKAVADTRRGFKNLLNSRLNIR